MGRGRQVIVGVGFAGALLVLGFGHLERSRPGSLGESLFSRPGASTPVAPNPAAREEAGMPQLRAGG
jgi:hypothetical protein